MFSNTDMQSKKLFNTDIQSTEVFTLSLPHHPTNLLRDTVIGQNKNPTRGSRGLI